MLLLTRKIRESVVVGGSDVLEQILKITVIEIRGGKVTLGFEADDSFPIHRSEVWERICAKGRIAGTMAVIAPLAM
jgi:carbon storage regulator CsrA